MAKKKRNSARAVSQTPTDTDKTVRPCNPEALEDAINAQRTLLFRAEAIAACLGRLLHEMYVPEQDEPDLAYVVDALRDVITGVVTELDPTNLGL